MSNDYEGDPTAQFTEADEEMAPTPEEMAEKLGCAVEDVADVLLERMGELNRAVIKLQDHWKPQPPPNRQMKRAMKRGKMPNNVPRVRK